MMICFNKGDKVLNGLDLFSGIGGITIGLSEWVRPIAYCDIEPYARKVLLSRMLEGKLPKAPIWDDVTTLRGRDLPSVDIIYGGFPCQDISVAGLGKGLEGERSGLFFEICRLAKEIKPMFIFLENVSAITGRGLDVVGKEISEMGYDCRWCCLSASEVGANHRRERWWLLAYSNSIGCNDGVSNREERHIQNSSVRKSSEVQQERNEWIDRSSETCPILSDTDSEKCSRLSCREKEEITIIRSNSEDVSDTTSERLEGYWNEGIVSTINGNPPFSRTFDSCFTRDWWSVEPCVGRVVNGVSFELDLFIFRHDRVYETCIQSDIEKEDAEINLFNRQIMRTMWEHKETAKTSPELYFRELQNIVPDLPQRLAYSRENIGQRFTEDSELCGLWERFFTASEQTEQAMWQERVLEYLWKIKCRETMEKRNRVDRIKSLGNAVVPFCAKEAFKILIGIK